MGILFEITNKNYRGISEDELADYMVEAAEDRIDRERAKKWAKNAGKHVSDREGVEEE